MSDDGNQQLEQLEQLDDETLMDRYCAGDIDAFDVLFQRYTPRLVRFLTNMVGPAQASDIAQITFIKVHENRHRYRLGSSVPSWVFTIARNTALDHIRSAPRRREVFGIETEHAADTPSRDKLRDEQVRAAISKLPDDQQQVIMLHWFGELTFEEVGKVVGATGAAVRVRAHRAYKKLRVTLEGLKQEVSS
jgi:RNA polymerase sigma-70 factor (ECF subfamily)